MMGQYEILKDIYRRISQITYQPKGVGKMEVFATLTLCISLNSGDMSSDF